MAYIVDQIRRVSGERTYMTPIDVSIVKFNSPNKFVFDNEMGANAFKDVGFSGDFKRNHTYYLRLKIERIPEGWYSKEQGDIGQYASADDMTFTLLLKTADQEDEEQYPPQILDTFIIKSLTQDQTDIGANTVYYSYVTVFTPNQDYNLLGLRMNRGAFDALVRGRTWLMDDSEPSQKQTSSGETLTRLDPCIMYNGEGGDIAELHNIVDLSESSDWLKLGFQSRPGTLIVVNNEPIRVGRSGIYELDTGEKITSFMITAPQGAINKNIDAFLLDYAYNE